MLNVSMTAEDWTTLLNASAMAPYSQIAPIIAKVSDQLVKEQQKANAPKVEAESGT